MRRWMAIGVALAALLVVGFFALQRNRSESSEDPSGRLAYITTNHVTLLEATGAPQVVGTIGSPIFTGPVWSADGRYLAWAELPERAASSVNAPEPWTVRVFDSRTRKRNTFASTGRLYSGQLLAIRNGFALSLSGTNNLGRGAADVALLRFNDDGTAREPVLIRPQFDYSKIGPQNGDRLGSSPEDFDFRWESSRNDVLFVVISGTSGTSYSYSPEFWQVTLDGEATRMWGECDEDPSESCTSNFGFSSATVSPDGETMVHLTGTRNGCDSFPRMVTSPVDRLAHRSLLPPAGEPELAPRLEGPQQYWNATPTWADNETVVVKLDRTPVGRGSPDTRCNAALRQFRYYRCSIDNEITCANLGITADEVVIDANANMASAGPGPSLAVTFASGKRRNLAISAADLTWSPGQGGS
jgi:hypothetical protein